MAFQKETIIDFSEVRKCPQVALEQMKLCMTSSLLGLISDLWSGNNKDPDAMETYEAGRLKKKKDENKSVKLHFQYCRNAKWKFPFFLFATHTFTQRGL